MLQKLIQAGNFSKDNEITSWVTDEVMENGESITATGIEEGEAFAQVRSRNMLLTKNRLKMDNWGIGAFSENISNYLAEMELFKDLDFLSVDEVIAEAHTLVKELGLAFDSAEWVYSCSMESLQKVVQREQALYEEIKMETDKDFNVTKEDEAYILYLYQGHKGIPFIPYELSSDITGSLLGVVNRCELTYSANGLESLTLRNPYDIGEVEETVEILSAGEILEQHYKRNAGSEETVIKMQLYYQPIHVEGLEFIAKPVWYILSDVPNLYSDKLTRDAVVYDAVTGQELPW